MTSRPNEIENLKMKFSQVVLDGKWKIGQFKNLIYYTRGFYGYFHGEQHSIQLRGPYRASWILRRLLETKFFPSMFIEWFTLLVLHLEVVLTFKHSIMKKSLEKYFLHTGWDILSWWWKWELSCWLEIQTLKDWSKVEQKSCIHW